MLAKLWRSAFVQKALGNLLAGYLMLVRHTTHFIIEPPNGYDAINKGWPVIVTIWHGQHFMLPYARLPHHEISVLVSGHGDGELNAIAAKKLGIGLVRGSGAQHAYQIRKRGGIKALRTMIGLLDNGKAVATTADVPKVSRVVGNGIIALARISGCPIAPIAVVTKNRIDFKSWDFASIGLPFFNRGVIVLGDLIYVPKDCDTDTSEALRCKVEAALDEVHNRAYALLGAKDPGANKISILEARIVATQQLCAASVAVHDDVHQNI
jgi:lysophospholipid acyltransferase (LPLAT)-like uncharacterized protein